MASSSTVVASDVVPVMTQITKHKLNVNNYFDRHQIIKLYLLSISMNSHPSDDLPSGDSKTIWLCDDAHLFLQLRNSIISEVVEIVFHCRTIKTLMKYLEFVFILERAIFFRSMMCVKLFTAHRRVLDYY